MAYQSDFLQFPQVIKSFWTLYITNELQMSFRVVKYIKSSARVNLDPFRGDMETNDLIRAIVHCFENVEVEKC